MASILGQLITVLSSNLIVLLTGFASGFLIPKALDLSQYAIFKTYSLYIEYAVLISLGFSDGLYLKYGGLRRNEISKREVSEEFYFYIITLAFISVIGIIIGSIITSLPLVLFSLSSFPMNLITAHRLVYQAIGEFKTFSVVNFLQSFLYLVFILGIFCIPALRTGTNFFLAKTIAYYLICIYLLKREHLPFPRGLSIREFVNHNLLILKMGSYIMIGNLSSVIFYSLDRWFVKIFLRKNNFAFYSFATSMMTMVLIVVTSVAMTFYPMLVRRQKEDSLIRALKNYIMILGALSSTAYFVLDLIVRWVLTEYISSLEVIAILFAGFPAIAVINAIYVNMYKAQKVEKKYFFTVFGMVGVSFGLNVLAVIINKSNWTIAAATTIAFYFWFFFSSKDFKGTKTNLREIAYLSAFLIVFFSTTRLLPWWLGLPLYLAGILGITLLFYKKEFFELIRRVSGALVKRRSASEGVQNE